MAVAVHRARSAGLAEIPLTAARAAIDRLAMARMIFRACASAPTFARPVVAGRAEVAASERDRLGDQVDKQCQNRLIAGNDPE